MRWSQFATTLLHVATRSSLGNQHIEFGVQTRDVLPGEFMLPDADHRPAAFTQKAIHSSVAGLVAGDFVAPEFRVLLGPGAVLRATVPDAAVYKYRQLQLRENDGRFLPAGSKAHDEIPRL